MKDRTGSPSLLAALLTLSLLPGSAALGASTIPVANGSFVDASNFTFTNNAGNISITVADVGNWVSRQSDATTQMLIADVTDPTYAGSATYTQDGSTSMMFRASSQRGLVQLIDVSGFNMTMGELTLSAIVSGKGNFPPSGILKMAGYNDLTGLTVDLGGSWDITGGTPAYDYGFTDAPATEIQGTSVTETLSGTSAVDFDYLLILVGGLAGDSDVNNKWVGVDHVQLSIVPEPGAASLLGLCGLVLLARRRRS